MKHLFLLITSLGFASAASAQYLQTYPVTTGTTTQQQTVRPYQGQTHGPVIQHNQSGNTRSGRLGYQGENPRGRMGYQGENPMVPKKQGNLGYRGENTSLNIVSAAKQLANLTEFINLIEKHGLFNYLQSADFTVFAPNDNAFADIKKQLGAKNYNEVQMLLKKHIVKGHYPVEQKLPETLETVAGTIIRPSSLRIQEKIPTSNGVINVVDTVIE